MPITLSKEEQLAFNSGLAAYRYFNDAGRLDLENFCVTLAACLYHDGTGLQARARPEAFHELLLEIIAERGSENLAAWVQPQRIVDWTPQHAYLYPHGSRTCIHVAALMLCSFDWISLIGSDALAIPDETWRPEYFGWAQESWQFTHAFLSGYHDALFRLAKNVDAKWANLGEVSTFETFQLAYREKLEFAEARLRLSVRNEAWRNTIERIDRAIADGYCLESISLTENFMSHLMFNFVSARSGNQKKAGTFNSLIQQVSPLCTTENDAALVRRVDEWRRRRNDAIHNYVSSSIDDLTAKTTTLTTASIETAMTGSQLARELLGWYRSAAVDFMSHNFPRLRLDD